MTTPLDIAERSMRLKTMHGRRRAILAAGDSWRWQLRDKNGKWIEMGSEVKWLARGRWLHGTVIGSPSPGIATVEELLTKIQRDIPSARLEVVNRAFALLEQVEQARDEKGRVDWRALDLSAPAAVPLPPEVTETPKARIRGMHQPPEDSVTLDDLANPEIGTFPNDVYVNPQYYMHTAGMTEKYERDSLRVIRQARGKPNQQVKIYRAVPDTVTEIEPGDWVSLSRAYAEQHAGDEPGWHILTATVPANTLRNGGNDLIEWGWFPPEAPEIPEPPEPEAPKIPERVEVPPEARDLKPGDVIRRYDDALVRVLSIDDRDDDYTEFTGVILSGPTAGTVTETSIKNGLPVQYQGSPPLQDFDQDVIAPARARLDALKAKYPDGMAAAIEQALSPPLQTATMPEMSDRLKELGRDVEVVRWMFDEQSEKDHLRELEFEYAPQDEIEAVREEVRRLSPEVMGGKILEYHTLLGEHRLAVAAFIDIETGDSDVITPHSDQAKEILAEVREIGAMVRVGIDIDLAQRGTVRDRPIDREIRAAKVKKADLIKKRVASRPTDPGHAEVLEELRQAMQAVNDLEAQAKSIPDPAVDPEYADEYDTDVARYRTRWKRRRDRSQQVLDELVGSATETKQQWVSKDPRTRINSTEKHRYLTKDEKQAMTDGLLRYPASWVQRFDQDQFTVSFADRGWNSDHEKHITISSSDGEGLSDGSNRIWATIVHEQGHTMEKRVPGLSGLEAMWWHDRMGELSPKTFHPDDGALFPDSNDPKKPKNINRPTSRPYTLKMYGNVYSKTNESWEIFTTGVQEVLGDGKTDFTYNGVEDADLWEFTMGALLTLDGQPASAPAAAGV
jgi:hypothetical protein